VVSDVTALAPALPFPFSSRRPPPRPTLFPYTTLFRSPPHVLVLQVTGRRPLVDAYGQGVGSGTQKRSDVELARQSTAGGKAQFGDRKSTRLNSSHVSISYAVFCLKKKR